jgi:Rieske 2Fe-2S family protein
MYDRHALLDLLSRSSSGHTLPQPFYTDARLYDFDVSVIFARCWLMIGFEVELPQPGAYLSTTIGPNPVLVVRGRDGAIRGFHNTCRHRGSQICAEGRGRTPRLVCPYHRWTYDLDGRLLGAARMPDDFKLEDHSLQPIRVERLAGCIYVALTDEVPDFAPFRAAAAPLLAPYGLTDARVAFESTLIEKANWKLVMENARECYHCAASHPELRRSFPVNFGQGFDFGESDHNRRYNERMEELGLPTEPSMGAWWHVGRYPLNPGMQSLSMDGRPVVARRLVELDEPHIGGLRWANEPNSFCHALPEYAFMFTAIPTGPQETRVVSKWLVHKDAVEGVDFQIDALTEMWTKTNLQDRELAENNQRGVNGLGYRPGPFSLDAEELAIRFNDWYRDTLHTACAHG